MNLESVSNDCCSDNDQLYVYIAQGETVLIEIQFPFPIMGYSFISTINFPTPIVLTNSSGIEIIDAELGDITMNLTSEQSQNIPAGQYPFDLWSSISNDPSFNTDPITGFFIINESITKIT